MRVCSAVLTLLALQLVPVARAESQAFPDDTAIRAMLEPRLAGGHATGVIVGLVENGRRRIIALGERSGPGSPAPDRRTVFEIGSITKAFTGILLGEMVARGEVALEDPVAKHLVPGARVPSRNGKEITLLDLATQSSGLPRLPSNLRVTSTENPYADYTPQMMYDFLAAYALPRDPGETYEYSNLGVGLLGHALWRRAGRDLQTLYLERILRPLGMRETRITLTPEMQARLARGHDASLDPAGTWDLGVFASAGALSSTVDDMLRFVEANLSPPSGTLGRGMALAREPRRPAGEPDLRIGLGWHVLEGNGRRIVWHNGGTGGYHAFVGFDTAGKRGVVMLLNTSVSFDDIGFHLLDPARPLRPPRPWPATVAVSPARLDEYVGEYQLAPAFSITITRDGDRIFGQGTGQSRFRMFPDSDSTFFLRAVPARLTFRRDSTGRVSQLILHQGGRDAPGRRVR